VSFKRTRAGSIGGDYYDMFNSTDTFGGRNGDVSVTASTGLVMAMVKAALTTLVEHADSLTFERLNDLVRRSTERRAF
jgi:serine phosphatase RsbU (regulator of sigma subunit)